MVQLEDTNDFIWDEFALITEEGLSYRISLCGFFFASLVYMIGKHDSFTSGRSEKFLLV